MRICVTRLRAHCLWLLVLSACSGNTASTAVSLSSCGLQLTYTGPTAAGTFAGLSESATQCEASSWRTIYANQDIPSGSLFVSAACQEAGDGSLDRPYCDLTSALEAIAQRDFRDGDTTATIHVDPGSYALNHTIDTHSVRATISGLCSTATTLEPATATAALLTLNSEQGTLKVEGVTVQGGATALLEVQQGRLTLANVRVELNNDNACFTVDGANSSLIGQYLDVDGNTTNTLSFQQPTSPSTSDATLSMPIPSADTPTCVRVSDGGQLQMEQFRLHDYTGIAVVVEETGSSATLDDGVIDTINPLSADGSYGYGVVAQSGATATLDGVSITNTYGVGIMADETDTTLTLTNAHVSAVQSNSYSGSGVGVLVQRGAAATIADTEIEDHIASGIFVSGGSIATVDNSSLRGSPINAVVADATLTITDSTLSDAQTLNAGFGGLVGILIESLSDSTAVTATLTNNIIQNNALAGFYLNENAGDTMTVTLDGNDFVDNGSNSGLTASAAVLGLMSGLTLTNNCVQGKGDVALMLDIAAAQLTGNTYRGSYDSFAIQQQRCGSSIAPVTVTAETVTSGAPHCLCGIRTDTATTCSALPLGPRILYDFGIGEVTVVQ